MAFGEPVLTSDGNPFYSLRITRSIDDVQVFFAELNASAVADTDTGSVNVPAADAAFQELLDLLGGLPNFTVSHGTKRVTTNQSATVTPAE